MSEYTDPTPPTTTWVDVVTGDTIDQSIQDAIAADAAAAAASATAAAASAASMGTSVTAAAASALAAASSATAAGTSATTASGSATAANVSAGDASVSAGDASVSAAAAAASAASLHGVIAGGTTGQALTKASNTDYDLAWDTVDLTNLNATNLTSGTVPDARFPATLPAASGVNLTALNASNLGSGTVPDARFPATLPATSGVNLTALPATLPAASGVNLTALNATNLGSGTVPDARFPATLPAASGVNLTALNASNLGSGTVPDARFPATLPAASGVHLTALSLANVTGWPSNSSGLLTNDGSGGLSWGTAPAVGPTIVGLTSPFTQSNNNTTLQNVTGLALPAVAGKYMVRGFLPFGCSSGQGIKAQLTSTGGTITLTYLRLLVRTDSSLLTDETYLVQEFATSSAALVAVTGTVTNGFIVFEGVLVVGTGATVQLQMAQNAAGAASANTFKTGSFLEYYKIA